MSFKMMKYPPPEENRRIKGLGMKGSRNLMGRSAGVVV